MRFRAKFGLLGWFCVSLALLDSILWLSHGRHSSTLPILVMVWIVLAVPKVLSQILIYWNLEPACLHERRLWSERNIPWEEVTRVSAWNPEQPSSDTLAIHYYRPAPMSDRGEVIANPEDRQQFLAEIRKYAPHAAFDV